MYREHADLVTLEQELDNLSRDEVNSLGLELIKLYAEYQKPTTIQALLRKNGIYNTDLLEQKLEIVRRKQEYLNDKFKIHDEIEINEHALRSEKFFHYSFGILSAICATVIATSQLVSELSNGEGGFLAGFGITGLLVAGIGGIANYRQMKSAKIKLRELKANLKAEKSEQKYRVELPQAGEVEVMQLPSEDKTLRKKIKWR